MNRVFKESTPFRTSIAIDAMPEKGYFIEVNITNVSPSIAAASFGYISYATLAVLPFWSTDNGNNIQYDLYKDGKLVTSHKYEMRRKIFIWIAMLPFIWVNTMTYYEREAFAASAYDFFDKSDTYINKLPHQT